MTKPFTKLSYLNLTKFILLFTILLPFSLYAQDHSAIITGNVITEDKSPVGYASVYIKNTSRGTTTDDKGHYYLRIPPGKHVLVVEALGYEPKETEITIGRNDKRKVDVILDGKVIEIEKAVLKGKSVVRQVNESAFNVVALDATLLHNTTMDLASVLDRASGIKIRETGGVGSDYRINLNGFSGKHVKVFMDGIPMEGSGSAFQINNIPVHLADRIEIYKGVVPVELGADALGGAINIVTRKTQSTYVDASYSYGSFNTHKSNLSVGHTTKSGFTFNFNAYQNYSDNSYKTKTELLDLETGNYSQEEHWFKRFHDNYHNEAVVAKVGVIGTKWADRLLLGITYSNEKADIQNSNIQKIVFGEKRRSAESIIPSLNYEKRNLFTENLNFSLSANYNKVKSRSIDVSTLRYNWAGESKETNSQGEGTHTDSERMNNSLYVTGNFTYQINYKHFFSLNHIFNTFQRKNANSVYDDTATESTYMKRKNNKNISGLSYKFAPVERWNAVAFAKYYNIRITGPVDVSTNSKSSYELQDRNYDITGYGLASTYMLGDGIQFKVSYEKSYRLPSETELFGDDVLEVGDVSLKPESSHNINFNISWNKSFDDNHAVFITGGLIYRDTRDYIRRQIEQRYGGAYYTNHGKVRTLGADIEARYFYKNKFSIGGNMTYQDIKNMEKYTVGGKKLIYYKDRMPNVPYLFSNVDASYSFFDVLGKNNILTLGYNMQYVHKFYRNWKSQGGDIMIPGQLSHDVTLLYSLKEGRYNIGLEAKNITNHLLYDNYSLQKPGRSFSVKLRYYFLKIK
ncbi:MAG: carboxypeptidase-like regulatory domain-containing protein [Rikenellaceae bacterium]|nr:carboxypeptidase-like regulatory domain-containing protein [Rikenellaceae bacterium]